MTEERPTFGPVVLLGLASAVVVAIAGNQPVAAPTGSRAEALATTGFVTYDAHLPAATAFALVVLACWGVVLVSRGKFRRAVSALGAVAAAAAVLAVASGYTSVPDDLRSGFAQAGYAQASVHHTAWFWVAAAACLLTLVAAVLAVGLTPRWPEMGTRYDAPSAAAPAASAAPATEDPSSLDLWKAMDEGRDPTN